MVYRYVRIKNLHTIGYKLDLPDSFTVECFEIIQAEIEKQKGLREKRGKINSRN